MTSDKEILRLATGFTEGLLDGGEPKAMCYAVTFPLQAYLEMCGIETELISGMIKTKSGIWSHFWLLLSDGRILDPTASQFKTPDGKQMPKIFIGEKPKWYKYTNTP